MSCVCLGMVKGKTSQDKKIKKSSQRFVTARDSSSHPPHPPRAPLPPAAALGLESKKQRKFSKKKQKPNKSHPSSSSSSSSQPTPPLPPPQQSVYKRETIYPLPTPWFTGPRDRFLVSTDESYQQIVDSSYVGYALQSQESFTQDFHQKLLSSFQSLDEKGIFQFDITQPGGLGTKTAKTFVTRCLIGDAGTTYKYLGLRMFSIPWHHDPNATYGGEEEEELLSEAQTIYELNQELISHTGELLEERNKPVRGHHYNLTLINR